MKTNFLSRVLIYPFLLCMVCSCKSETSESQTQPAYIKALFGRWEVVEATVFSHEPNKDIRKLGTFRTGLAYIFYDNNSYDGCIQSGSDWDNAGQSGTVGTWKCSTDKLGSWTLKVGNSSSQKGYLDEDSFITLKAPTLTEPQEYKFYYMDDKSLILGLTPKKDGAGTETWMSLTLEKK